MATPGARHVVSGVKGVRLCLKDDDDVIRKIARIFWDNRDSSLYISSYCPPGGRSFAGRLSMPPASASYTWDFTGQIEGGDEMPRMSLHQSGRTKTHLAGRNSRFVYGQPLTNGVGGHIATIKTFNPSTLPTITKSKKGTHDIVTERGDQSSTSVRFPLAVRPTEELAQTHAFYITFNRPILQAPVYVGIDVFGEHEPQNDGDGVIVIGGWGPDTRPSEVCDIAFTTTQSIPAQ